MTGKIRIIGGRFKGKQIPVLARDDLRPTPNRVRETLFNWLMFSIQNSVCLDAFAGTGALGLEAYSRGAKTVLFVEKDPTTFKQLQQTTDAMQMEGLRVIQADFLTYLNTTPQQFDLIFLDPPFQAQVLLQCLQALQASSALKPDGLVYLESDQPLPVATPDWEMVKSSKAGQVYFGLYTRDLSKC